MNGLENLKRAINNRKPLKITMYDKEKGISDTDIYTYWENKYRCKIGIGIDIKDLLEEIKNETWLKIEVVE